MLVLTRKEGERIVVNGKELVITILRVEGNRCRIGFEAPEQVEILRGELVDKAA
jgi:carbon storage regulator